MRFLPVIYAAALICALSVQTYASPSGVTVPASQVMQSDDSGDDKDATGGKNPADKKADESPQEAAKRIGVEKQPLLPERPKDFNPMIPPTAIVNDDNAGLQPGLMGGGAATSMYMNEFSGFAMRLLRDMRWLVIIAGIGTLLFFIQLFSLRRSAAFSRKSLEGIKESTDTMQRHLAALQDANQKELRAYVFTSGAKGELTEDKTGEYGVKIEVKNYGYTPAYDVIGWMSVFVDDITREREFSAPPRDADVVEMVLPPGGVCFYYAQSNLPVARELKAIGAGSRAIFVYGEVRYKDIFGAEHFLSFRIKCTGERNLKTGSFDHCLGGNKSN